MVDKVDVLIAGGGFVGLVAADGGGHSL